jgi:hypothetical protein
MEINIAFRYICLIVSVGGFISSLEYLLSWKHYQNGGAFSWKILSQGKFIDKWFLTRYLSNLVLGYPGVLGLFLLRSLAFLALFILSVFDVGHQLIAVTVTLFSSCLIMSRQSYGGEGSDHILLVSLVPLFIHFVGPKSLLVSQICLYFIALQSCVSYVTSGTAKLISHSWMSGNALHLIMGVESFGYLPLSKFLQNKIGLSKMLSWSVITLECSFLLVLFLPPDALYVILSFSVLMHVSIAFFMGLNIFPWTFIATYPAIIFTHYQMHQNLDFLMG